LRAIFRLPHEGDIKQLSNAKNKFRLRVGGYRVIYSVFHDILLVEVLEADNRGDIY